MRHPVDYAPSQDFGDNPTSILPASHWIIKQFGNYQPDGHTGTDYPCPAGTSVRAAADGTVLHAGWFGGTYADNPWWISPSFAGFTYVVDHGHFIGIYGHCQDGGARVRVGQQVIEGQVLGLSGNTGASTGPHLHFEALPDGYVLNSRMFGRINPASLFGGISTQGTTNPVQEDDVTTPEQIERIVTASAEAAQAIVNHAFERLMNEMPPKTAKAVLNEPVPYKDPLTGQDTGQTTTLSTVTGFTDFNEVQTRLAKSSPTEIASLVPEAFVAEVVKLLTERLSA